MRWVCVGGVVLIAGLSYGQAERPRISIPGNVSPLTAAAEDLGEVEGARPMPRMAIRFRKTPEQEQDLEQLLEAQQTRGNALYHRWLTPAGYADRFGVTEQDAEAVAEWLRQARFSDLEIAPSRTSVNFTGNAGQVKAAFGAAIHAYAWGGKNRIANAGEPSVPGWMAAKVGSIAGLHDFKPAPQSARRMVASGARWEFTDGDTGNFFLTPDDFETIYNVQPLYAAGMDGSGVKIAIAGSSDIDLADIRSFRAAAGLPQKDPVVVLAGTDPGTDVDAETEADLDLEWSGGIARNATIIYVNSTDPFTSAAYAIEHNLAPILSMSFGECEAQVGAANLNSIADLFEQANAQGITALASSGDAGAAECDAPNEKAATKGLAVVAPASIPYVTGVGGTTLLGSPEVFGPVNNRRGGSASGYVPEIPWNDSGLTGTLLATGGGRSTVFRKPAWQAGTNIAADGTRDVPDVVLAASPNQVGYLICSQRSCVNGFRNAGGNLEVVGGTSCGPPAMAGIVALLDETTGEAQGNVNPELYRLANFAPVFHSIDEGTNEVPCTAGSPDCANGYEGYDSGQNASEVTGLGSVNAFELLNSWGEAEPATIATPNRLPLYLFSGSGAAVWTTEWYQGIYVYTPQTQAWNFVSNVLLYHMAVSGSVAWGLDVFGNIYRWNAASQSFEQVPGTLAQIAAGSDGDAWGVNANGAIFHFDGASQTWKNVPGELSTIAVGFDGAVWGINNSQAIFRFNPGLGAFEYVPGELADIQVGADGGVLGVNAGGNVYHFNRLRQAWDQIGSGMEGAVLAVGSDANAWMSQGETTWRYNAALNDFYSTGTEGTEVAASVDGSAWSMAGDAIAELSPPTVTLNSWHEIPGQLAQLSAASDGTVWGVNASGQIYTFNPLAQQWRQIPGTLAQIGVARDGAAWGVNPWGSVYRYDYAKANWDLMAGTMAEVIPADNGDVWALDKNGTAYRFDGTAQNWTAMGSAVRQIAVGVDGAAWAIDAQGGVESFDAQSQAFVAAPGAMAQISVGSSANVWAVDAAGLTYRFNAQGGEWQHIEGQPLTQVQAAYDGSVWGIDAQGLIWRYNAGTGGWDYIPGELQSLSVGADAVVWGINSWGGTYYFR
ncbi:MAG: hypothetical protein JO340_09920 [Acidobacteriaceae bacterium]|nr:hypothetical protein [Acidobacteriaceae bacterium]